VSLGLRAFTMRSLCSGSMRAKTGDVLNLSLELFVTHRLDFAAFHGSALAKIQLPRDCFTQLPGGRR
jgi:hypothetical protein